MFYVGAPIHVLIVLFHWSPKQAGLSRFREETEMLKSIYGQVSFHIGNKSMPVRKNMDGQVNYMLYIENQSLPF